MRCASSLLALALLAAACAHHPAKPATCADDADCTGGTWCRPTEAGGSECVPFAGEGQRCGGFVVPATRERCAPGLTCTDWPEPTHDVPGFCREVEVSCDQRPPTYPFTNLERGTSYAEGAAGLELIRTPARLAEVYQQLGLPSSPPALDFGQEMVVFYSMGTQRNGCHAVEIESLHVGSGQILAGIEEVEPGPKCLCTQAQIQPYHLVRAPAQTGDETACVRRETRCP